MSSESADRRLGVLLLERELVTQAQLSSALAEQSSSTLPLGHLLVNSTDLSVEDLTAALSHQLDVPHAQAEELDAHEALDGIASVELLQDWECIPLGVEGQTLKVALTRPTNRQLHLEIKQATGYRHLKVCLITHRAFSNWLQETHQLPTRLAALIQSASDIQMTFPHTGENGPDNVVHSIFKVCLNTLLIRHAESIHFEPELTTTRCRIRVHGRRETVCRIPSRFDAQITDVLRQWMGRSYESQGAFRVRHNNTDIQLRVEMIHTTYGQSITLYKCELQHQKLSELGFSDSQVARLEAVLSLEGGLVLVAGPEGSGVSTTLNALACHTARPDELTMAISSSSESVSAGVLTIPLLPEQSVSSIVHAAIRQNPDVLIIDNHRPSMDLWPAFTATMSGTRVLMKVSAVRAIDAITQSSCPSYTLASVLRAVISQRLLRQVCSACAEGVSLDDSVMSELGIEARYVESATFKEGRGCASCGGTGYRGIIIVRETLIVPDAMRPMIRDSANAEQLISMAREHGFTTLWEEAIWAVIKGLTTVAEIRAALMS